MRICIVTTAGYVHGIGGMQDHTVELARGLVAAGHDVEALTARDPAGRSEAQHAGVTWHFVDGASRNHDEAWLRRSAVAFAALEARRPFDVVHSQASSGLGLLRAGVHRRVPVVVAFHGSFLGHARAAVAAGLAASSPRGLLVPAKELVWLAGQHFPHGNWYRFRACEAIVPSHRELKDTCRSHLLDRSRVHVVPNGVDVDVFRPRTREPLRRRLGLPAGLVFACVGRLHPAKGYDHAIAALARLGGEGAGARLLIVGEGGDRERLGALARAAGVADRVVFAGGRPQQEVAELLAAADVFLFPTTLNEAAPLTVLQAMASGTPVVATRIGAIPEAIDREGANGILVPPADVAALAAAMRSLADDPARRAALAAAARARVLAEFSLERMVERTVAVYELALARRRTGSWPAPAAKVTIS